MKKTLAILLALAMCLSLAACGKSGTATGDEAQAIVDGIISDAQSVVGPVIPEAVPDIAAGATTEPETTTPEATEPATEPEPAVEPLPEGGQQVWGCEAGDRNFNAYYYYTDDAKVYAGFDCVDAATGEEIWTFVTEPEFVGQLDNYTIIGLTTAGFVFTKEDVVYCLNFIDGQLEWKSEPMDIWPTGYYAIDDDCRFYFPGYFNPALVVVGCDGQIQKKYDLLEDMYGNPIENSWCCGIRLDEFGHACINYSYEAYTTYAIDPETGECIDEYPTTISLDKEQIIGTWMDNYYGGDTHVIMTIDDDLNFDMTIYNEDGSPKYNYLGYFEIGDYIETVGSDWLVSHLTSTNDPNFKDWDGIGDYVFTYFHAVPEFPDMRTLELTQINNGDSVLSWYYDMFGVILTSVQPVG